jgi:hypothetical protein
MDSVKCTVCRVVKFEKEFMKNGKTLKSCNECRAKKAKTVSISIPIPLINEVVTNKVMTNEVMTNEMIPIIEKEIKHRGWIRLSGIWIERGDELELHQQFTRKLNREFKKKSAPYIHKLFTRYLMTDIRDLFISD